jgi:hypothetical protein
MAPMNRILTVVCVATATFASLSAQDSPPQSKKVALASSEKFERPDRTRNGGYLGIFFEEILHESKPALHIVTVLKGSDADRLGFHAGDKIVAVDGRAIPNGDGFIKMLWYQGRARRGAARQPTKRRGNKSGTKKPAVVEHTISLLRAGKKKTIRAGLKELDRTPAVGSAAPDFTLAQMDGKTKRKLSSLIGKKPVFLVFGSYT